tara:strand:- start:161 stop:298 length:138 start_codon:yes stop_codon:yes gene_type:complete
MADDDIPYSESYKLMQKLDELIYKEYEFIVMEGIDHAIDLHDDWP